MLNGSRSSKNAAMGNRSVRSTRTDTRSFRSTLYSTRKMPGTHSDSQMNSKLFDMMLSDMPRQYARPNTTLNRNSSPRKLRSAATAALPASGDGTSPRAEGARAAPGASSGGRSGAKAAMHTTNTVSTSRMPSCRPSRSR